METIAEKQRNDKRLNDIIRQSEKELNEKINEIQELKHYNNDLNVI